MTRRLAKHEEIGSDFAPDHDDRSRPAPSALSVGGKEMSLVEAMQEEHQERMTTEEQEIFDAMLTQVYAFTPVPIEPEERENKRAKHQ
jgi:hypothetical protein